MHSSVLIKGQLSFSSSMSVTNPTKYLVKIFILKSNFTTYEFINDRVLNISSIVSVYQHFALVIKEVDGTASHLWMLSAASEILGIFIEIEITN